MPLIKITMTPGYQLKLDRDLPGASVSEATTRKFIKLHLSQSLPQLMVKYAPELNLDPDTPPEGVQVTNRKFKKHDVNTPGVWIKVQFSENKPSREERLRIREKFNEIVLNWFVAHDLILDSYAIDLIWGPTNGRAIVNGVKIAW